MIDNRVFTENIKSPLTSFYDCTMSAVYAEYELLEENIKTPIGVLNNTSFYDKTFACV